MFVRGITFEIELAMDNTRPPQDASSLFSIRITGINSDVT